MRGRPHEIGQGLESGDDCHCDRGLGDRVWAKGNADAEEKNWMRWWDPGDPLHVGHTGEFLYLSYFFGGFKGQ